MPFGETAWDITDQEIKSYPVWSCLVAHSRPPFTPLYFKYWYYFTDGFSCVNDWFGVPTSHGITYKHWHGHCYVTYRPTTEETRKERERRYREVMAPIIDDPWKFVEDIAAEAYRWEDPLIPLEVEKMDEWELYRHLWDVVTANAQAGIRYNMGWCGISSGLGLFQQLAAELAGIKHTDPEYSRMLGGHDNKLYRSNAGLAELAARAVELNLEDNLKLGDEEALAAMEQSEAGRKWLEGLHAYVREYGMRVKRMYEICEPGWYEQPGMLISYIRRYAEMGGVHTADVERERLAREREETIREFLAKIPVEHQEWMKKLLTMAQVGNFFSEECAFIEFKRHALLRRVYMEYGRRFAQDDMIEKADDVLMLLPDEILSRCNIREKGLYKPVVEERRREHNSYLSFIPGSDDLPIFLGDPAKAGQMLMEEPMISVLVAVPEVSAEAVGADLVGAAGTPGVVEGIARVIMSEAEWDQIQPGDILVTPMTSAVWTPLFGLIKGVVCDSGGALAHPVIVSREYGIPCVAGCLQGTMKIKTGDKIRIDGDMCRVYILERAGGG